MTESVVILTDAFTFMRLRCHCPACERLDKRFPNEGYQLELFEYLRDNLVDVWRVSK